MYYRVFLLGSQEVQLLKITRDGRIPENPSSHQKQRASTPKLNRSPSFACVARHVRTGMEFKVKWSRCEPQFAISRLCDFEFNVEALYS